MQALKPSLGESYLDLTAGYAGHASSILAVTQNYKNAVLVDRDDYAIQFLKTKYPEGEVFEDFSEAMENGAAEKIKLLHKDFYNATLQMIECGKRFDLILADFGVSSPQLDNADRGFSFAKDGPLDMRMDRSQELTAATIVNKWSMRALIDIFEKYGEMSAGFARKVAREIVMNRPFNGTLELANVIAGRPKEFRKDGSSDAKLGAGGGRRGKVHPATKAFQAIRIVVNDELGEIERTLPLLPKVLAPGGRVAIITFHSLEDRLVKEYFREASSLGEESELKLLNKSPIVAGSEELVINSRARSAKLRAAIKR